MDNASIAVISGSRTRPNRTARASAPAPLAASVAAPKGAQQGEMHLQALTNSGAGRGRVHAEAGHGKEVEEEEEEEEEEETEKQQGQDRKGEKGRKEEKGESRVGWGDAESIEGREEGAGCLEFLVNEAERLQIGIASPAGSGGWGGGGRGGGGSVDEKGNDREWEEGRREERQPQPSPESVTNNLANPQPSPRRAFPPLVRPARHSPPAPVSGPGGMGGRPATVFGTPPPPSGPPFPSSPAKSPYPVSIHHRAGSPIVDASMPTSFQRMPRDLKTGRRVCFYFNSTTCAAGTKCTFLHVKVDSSLITPGTFYKPVSTSIASSTGPPAPPPSVPAFFIPVVHPQHQQYFYHHASSSSSSPLALLHPMAGGKVEGQHQRQQQQQQQQQYHREVAYKQAGHTFPLALPRHPHAGSPPFSVPVLPSAEAASPPFPSELPPSYRPYGPASAPPGVPTYVVYYQYPPSYPPSFSPSLPPSFPPHFHGGVPEKGGEGRWGGGWDDAQVDHHQMQQEQQALGRREGRWEGGLAEEVEGDMRAYHHQLGHDQERHQQHQQHQQHQRQPRRQQQQYQRHYQ